MEEFINFLNTFELTKAFIMGIKVFIPTMAWVYLFGRMLNIAKKDETKNLVAFLSIIFSLAFNALFNEYYDWYFIGSVSVVIYVLLGFNLYSRVDSFLDKFAKNKEERRKRK